MAKFCRNCGEELKEGAVVCLNCGKKIAETQSTSKDLDKNLVIAIVIGVIGFVLIVFFWFFVALVEEFDDASNVVSHSAKKSCCIKAGGTWANDTCVSGYWFDDDYYDSCIENSF
ncbi:MAG: zinc-ribbon domain-containing protein [Bacilli bacterium]|nr:zinc-ribbon domain-containing protein [Bacilli bacterium]